MSLGTYGRRVNSACAFPPNECRDVLGSGWVLGLGVKGGRRWTAAGRAWLLSGFTRGGPPAPPPPQFPVRCLPWLQLEIAKDEAMIEMKRTQAKLAGDRRARERELAERQAEVTAARKMEEWRLQRETIRQEMAAEMRGDLSADQEARLTAALHEKEAANEALKLASKERADRAAALEEAFMAIKQATGVSTVEEMVDKFLNQGSFADLCSCLLGWGSFAFQYWGWGGGRWWLCFWFGVFLCAVLCCVVLCCCCCCCCCLFGAGGC